jgi:hypothetical protein
MINWDSYFDHIYVISRCKNFNRRNIINYQCKKLNIRNYNYWYVPDYDFNNKDSKYFVDHSNTHELASTQRATFGHYTLWKTCYELNYDNVLIIEDDALFIDDESIISNALNTYKKNNYDIYMFDYWNVYETPDMIGYILSTCYCANKKGLEYLINMNEKYYLYTDCYFYKFKDHIKNLNEYSFYHDCFKDVKITLNNEYLNLKFEVSPEKICYQNDKNY